MHILTVILAAGIMTGCSTFTIDGNVPKSENARAQEMTVNATSYDSEKFINACSDPKANLAAIRFHTNPIYWFASLLSLGLYVPQHVTLWCDTEATQCSDNDTSGQCEPYVREDD